MNDDRIEEYLDELLGYMRGGPRAVRRMLTEAEHHLLDAEAEALAAGATPDEAAESAIARFGPARDIAARSNRASGVPLAEVARQLTLVGALLASIGLLAIGVSGIIAAALGSTLGARFVAGDLPGVTYTPARCRDFFEYAPHATSCLQAAAIHHFGEVVFYRLLAGALGAIALVAYALLRKRWRMNSTATFLTPAVGTTVFALATVVLAGQTVNGLTQGRDAGAGQWASAVVVTVPLTLAFGLALVGGLRRPPSAIR